VTTAQLRLLLMTAKLVRRLFAKMVSYDMFNYVEKDQIQKSIDEAIFIVEEEKDHKRVRT